MVPIKMVSMRPVPFAPMRRTSLPFQNRVRRAVPSTLGKKGASMGVFASENIPSSVAIATGGAVAFMVSGVLPLPFNLLFKGLGVAAVGYGVYNLFSGVEKKPVENYNVPAEELLPASPGQVEEQLGVAMPSAQPNTGGTLRWTQASQDFEFNATNRSKRKISFFAGVVVSDAETGEELYRTPNSNDPSFGRKTFSIDPGETSGFQEGFFVSVPRGRISGGISYRDVDVQLEIFRTLTDLSPVFRADAIPVRFTRWVPLG